ncbi:MAG TPA: aminoglycoside phosphotransferase family protein, partial [Ilumatobacteraceae bacterium]
MTYPSTLVQVADAARFVSQRFGESAGPVEHVGDGAWSRCFGFTLDGSELVIRFGRHLEDFEHDRIAARFATRNLPIPQVIEIDAAFDGWYCVSTRSRGTPLELLDPIEWQATVPSVLALLDALRRTDISATTGFGAWNSEGTAPHATWADYLASVIDDPPGDRTHGWKRRLLDSSTGDASFCRAFEVMAELADTFVVDRNLVHNDLLNRNALAWGGEVTAVFDWGCSIYGDFLYELATFLFWGPWHSTIERSDMLT